MWNIPGSSCVNWKIAHKKRTAISLFGLRSGAALATVVGVLVEVQVMLSMVHMVRRTRPWFELA